MPRIASADTFDVALLLAGAGCCPADHQTGQSVQRADVALARVPPPATTAPAAEPPVGSLGLPLGTVARIRGAIVLGQDVNYKLYSHGFLLRVTHVNGRERAEKPVMEFHVPAFIAKELADSARELYEMKHGETEQPLTAQQLDALERGYAGKTFVLDVYEEGKFAGIPDDLPGDVPPWQGQGFGFRTWLMVVAER
jgi:hypothetical protein